MSEWWTYRPSDFLMFSPHIYWRLFQSLNEAWWPAQPFVVGTGLTWLVLQRRVVDDRDGMRVRAAAAFLAVCWVVVAVAFLQQRFSPINWVASGYAAAFVLQGLGLLALALTGGVRTDATGTRRAIGLTLGLWALLGHPLLSVAAGRPWQQAEVFGLAPDPTAVGTLAFLCLMSAATRSAQWLLRSLWAVPLLWCAISAATLGTMGALQAWVLVAAAGLAAAAWRR